MTPGESLIQRFSRLLLLIKRMTKTIQIRNFSVPWLLLQQAAHWIFLQSAYTSCTAPPSLLTVPRGKALPKQNQASPAHWDSRYKNKNSWPKPFCCGTSEAIIACSLTRQLLSWSQAAAFLPGPWCRLQLLDPWLQSTTLSQMWSRWAQPCIPAHHKFDPWQQLGTTLLWPRRKGKLW